MILAATNRPESLDPALTRPGRFDRRVPVEPVSYTHLDVYKRQMEQIAKKLTQYFLAHGLIKEDDAEVCQLSLIHIYVIFL